MVRKILGQAVAQWLGYWISNQKVTCFESHHWQVAAVRSLGKDLRMHNVLHCKLVQIKVSDNNNKLKM